MLRVLINGFKFADHESSEKHERARALNCLELRFQVADVQGRKISEDKEFPGVICVKT